MRLTPVPRSPRRCCPLHHRCCRRDCRTRWTWSAGGSAGSGAIAAGCCPAWKGTGSSSGRSTPPETTCSGSRHAWQSVTADRSSRPITAKEGQQLFKSFSSLAVTWLGRGKWGGLWIPTCHSGTATTGTTPAGACEITKRIKCCLVAARLESEQ